MSGKSQTRGGYADMAIPNTLVHEVVMFLQSVLQRGNHIIPISLEKPTGIYQLDPQNDWHLIPLHDDVYRLGARYDNQIVVDSLAILTRWHFLLDGWIGYDGATHMRPEDAPISQRWSSSFAEEDSF